MKARTNIIHGKSTIQVFKQATSGVRIGRRSAGAEGSSGAGENLAARDYLRRLRAAEMAAWESTGGDYLASRGGDVERQLRSSLLWRDRGGAMRGQD